jgi:hypothetical protein
MKTKIEIPISDCLVTGKKRKIKHRQLRILDDLQMVHDLEIIYYNEDDVPMLQIIQGMEITEDQKDRLKKTFANVKVSASTKGVWVDEQGQPVSIDTDGAIDELEFWQNIPLAVFQGAQTISDVVYAAMEQNMSVMNQRNRF